MDKKWYKIFLKVFFVVVVIYFVFLIVKTIYLVAVNTQYRESNLIFGYFAIPLIFGVLSLAIIFALKQKNILTIALSVVPLLLFAIPYFMHNAAISIHALIYMMSYGSTVDKAFIMIDVISYGIIILSTAFMITISIIQLIKIKSPKSAS